MEWLAVLCVLDVLFLGDAATKVWCRNEANQRVDWFLMYKVPKNVKVTGASGITGGSFLYMDSKTADYTYWHLSKQDIFQEENPVAYTLHHLFLQKREKIAYVAYNDQPFTAEGEKPAKKAHVAHAKGILMADRTGGAWLLHSVPRFPMTFHRGYYNMTRNGALNGQMFMCLSVKFSEIDKIAHHLLQEKPGVTQQFIPEYLIEKYPILAKLITGRRNARKSDNVVFTQLTSEGKHKFIAVSKPSSWKQDIYTGAMTSALRDSVCVQSWRRVQFGLLQADCISQYTVQDVDAVKLRVNKTCSFSFFYNNDHSKYVVALHNSMFCFSSLNRGATQYGRGGELLCFRMPKLANLFLKSVSLTDCPDILDTDANKSSNTKKKSLKLPRH